MRAAGDTIATQLQQRARLSWLAARTWPRWSGARLVLLARGARFALMARRVERMHGAQRRRLQRHLARQARL